MFDFQQDRLGFIVGLARDYGAVARDVLAVGTGRQFRLIETLAAASRRGVRPADDAEGRVQR